MRRSFVLIAFALIIFIVAVSCDLRPPVTFEEVSQPYLEKYGTPEEETRFDSGDYHIVDWWWWTRGHEVTFADSPYDDVNGWTVSSTYDFPPIL